MLLLSIFCILKFLNGIDGHLFATLSKKTIKIWNLTSETKIYQHQKDIHDLALFNNYLIGVGDKFILKWDYIFEDNVSAFTREEKNLRVFSLNSKNYLIIDNQNMIIINDISDSLVKKIEQDPKNSLNFKEIVEIKTMYSQNQVVMADKDYIEIRDLNNFEITKSFKTGQNINGKDYGEIRSLDVLQNDLIVFGRKDIIEIYLFNNSLNLINRLELNGEVKCLSVFDIGFFASGIKNSKNNIIIWNNKSKINWTVKVEKDENENKILTNEIFILKSLNESFLISGIHDKTVAIWKTDNLTLYKQFDKFSESIKQIVVLKRLNENLPERSHSEATNFSIKLDQTANYDQITKQVSTNYSSIETSPQKTTLGHKKSTIFLLDINTSQTDHHKPFESSTSITYISEVQPISITSSKSKKLTSDNILNSNRDTSIEETVLLETFQTTHQKPFESSTKLINSLFNNSTSSEVQPIGITSSGSKELTSEDNIKTHINKETNSLPDQNKNQPTKQDEVIQISTEYIISSTHKLTTSIIIEDDSTFQLSKDEESSKISLGTSLGKSHVLLTSTSKEINQINEVITSNHMSHYQNEITKFMSTIENPLSKQNLNLNKDTSKETISSYYSSENNEQVTSKNLELSSQKYESTKFLKNHIFSNFFTTSVENKTDLTSRLYEKALVEIEWKNITKIPFEEMNKIWNIGSDINDCLTNCSNSGTCYDVSKIEFRCKCFENFTGTKCQYNTQLCSSNPCLNQGRCLDSSESYTCLCLDQYYGKNCELKYDICKNETCFYNGVCKDVNNTAKCDCFYLYSGNKCEIKSEEIKRIKIIVKTSSIICVVILAIFYLSFLFCDIFSCFISDDPTIKKLKKKSKQTRFRNNRYVYIN